MRLLTLALIALPLFAWSQEVRPPGRHIALLGGSGDSPRSNWTLFDTSIGHVANYASQSQSQTRVAFDGGHSVTEGLISQHFPGSPEFTNQTYMDTIRHYEAEIRAGRITRGDQVMVVVNTHGASPSVGQLTHSISAGRGHATNLNTLSGSQTASMDSLQSLTRLAEQNGIKLAILDLSCHSGASLPLANSKTCVISAAGPNSFGYGGTGDNSVFSNALLTRMRPGRSLEEVFHEARLANRDISFPMISGGAGKAVQDLLYPIMSRYQNALSSSALSDKLRNDLAQSVITNSCEQEQPQVDQLIALSRQVEAGMTGANLESFRQALQEYADYRKSLQDNLRRMGIRRLHESVQVCRAPGNCMDVRISFLIGSDGNANLETYRRELAAATTSDERARAQEWIRYFEDWQRVRRNLLAAEPNLASAETYLDNDSSIVTRTNALAQRVANEGRVLYASMVRQRQSSESNPCRDFRL